MSPSFPRSVFRWLPVLVLAGLGFCAVAVEVDPGGDFPNWPGGPGLTLDEGFNAEEGVRLVEGLKLWATGTLTWQEVYGRRENLGVNAPVGYHLADHPPGARIWLGLWHDLGWAVFHPDQEPTHVCMALNRLGSAAAFGLLMLLVGVAGTLWYGQVAGLAASASLLLMPRVFGHAHLTSLETTMNLTYLAAILSVARWCGKSEDDPVPSITFRKASWAGLCWGLALLTKIQAVLIGPPVVVWTLWHWRKKAIVPLLVWGGTGLIVFFIGWPWLWFDPLDHARQFFHSSTNRSTLYVYYFGERFADTAVPWHYPFVFFMTTIPLGLLALGLWGSTASSSGQLPLTRDRKLQLMLLATLFPLILFALPGVAVYDGERLFLVSFAVWSLAIGRGTSLAYHKLAENVSPRWAGVGLALVFLLQGYGLWATRPCYLSYYNLLIGGLPGAERLGLETNYWGDALTRDFWDKIASTVPEGSTLEITPVVHPFQLQFMASQLPQLRDRNITLEPCLPEKILDSRYVVQFERRADVIPEIEEVLNERTPQIEVTRQGVRLAAFYDLAQD